MPYDEAHLIEIVHLKLLSEAVKEELNDLLAASETLNIQLQTLSNRYDANVKASTDSDADYAAELVDARVDAWAEEHGSLGANIRDGQQKVSDILCAVEESQETLQSEVNLLTTARMKEAAGAAYNNERRRKEISGEMQERQESDGTLQTQLQALSEAIMKQSVMLAEIRKTLQELKQEE